MISGIRCGSARVSIIDATLVMLRRIGESEIVDGLQILRLVTADCIISDLTLLALNPKKSTHIVKKAMSAIRLVFELCPIISYEGDRRQSGPGPFLSEGLEGGEFCRS